MPKATSIMSRHLYPNCKIRPRGKFLLGFIVLSMFPPLMTTYRYLSEWPVKTALKLTMSYNKAGEIQSNEKPSPTHITNVPFFATIVHENNFCSGTLIGSRTILTTAVCVAKIHKDQLTHTVAKVGCDVLAGEGQVVPVIDIKVHEYYRRLTIIDNDIALVIVAVSTKPSINYNVPFSSRVKKALLVEPEIALRDDFSITMFGWGIEDDRVKEQTYRLIQTPMTVMARDQCIKILPHIITPSTFCTAYRRRQPLGDIGGPALVTTSNEQVVVGITSYNGYNFTVKKETVAVITNVSHFYRWILKNTAQLMSKHCIKTKPSDPTGYDYYELK